LEPVKPRTGPKRPQNVPKSLSPAKSPEGLRSVAHLFGPTTWTRANPLGATGPSARALRAQVAASRRRRGVCTQIKGPKWKTPQKLNKLPADTNPANFSPTGPCVGADQLLRRARRVGLPAVASSASGGTFARHNPIELRRNPITALPSYVASLEPYSCRLRVLLMPGLQ
jgi:hypothetical protein